MSFTPPDSDRVFVLGAEQDPEGAVLGSGDYTEVSQTVNLDGIDLVLATMDTIGPAMEDGEAPAQLSNLADTFLNYPMNDRPSNNGAADDSPSGVDLAGEGDLAIAGESYGFGAGFSRRIPIGSTTAWLRNVLAPDFWPSSVLGQYSIDFSLYFDSDAYPTSWGISPGFFSSDDGVSGLSLSLVGATGPGAHQWRFQIGHRNGGSSFSVFPSYAFDATTGWHFFTISWPGVGNPAELYVDGALSGLSFSPFTLIPAKPVAGTPLVVATPALWGYVDNFRVGDAYHDLAAHQAAYAEILAAPTPVAFEWLMQVLVDGEVYAERVISEDERRRWTEVAAPVRRLHGNHEVAFRLQLQEV